MVAPDKFKGSLTGLEAAEAMMRGARSFYPAATFLLRPMADGGEGSLDALLLGRGGHAHDLGVTHPLGATVIATFGTLGDIACVEMAKASGLQLVAPADRDALAATSLGTGELIAAALRTTPRTLMVAVGGSASTDGGTGAARALGWRFLDASGNDLPLGGGALVDLARIVPPASAPPAGTEVIGACDVDSPLVGPRGAARRFAVQKGAAPDEVDLLETALGTLAVRMREDLGIDVGSLPGAGAGGGMGAGLAAFFGARLVRGFEAIAEATGLRDDIAGADLVITGEGRLDEQSLAGKVPIGIGDLARGARVTCIAVVGDLQVERATLRTHGIESAVGIVQTGGAERSARDPAGALEVAVTGLLKHRDDRRTGRRLRRSLFARR